VKLLLDTNILVQLSKDSALRLLERVVNPDDHELYISIASIAEIKSIALQNLWGGRKWQIIDRVLDEAVIIEINEDLANTYAEIDAFSQRRNPAYNDYLFKTPRNMGKNDLWIAATGALLGLQLVTTDTDFNHLHQVFLDVRLIKPE
jgi:tRNA(fMet)-specific endonuclease VapC